LLISPSKNRASFEDLILLRKLEELFLPAVEERGRNAELIADGGHGDVFKQVPLEGGDLLLGGEVTTFAVHDGASVQVRLTRTERFSRFD